MKKSLTDELLKIRPRLFVSACLLGQAVRYDGRHKRDDGVLALAENLDLYSLCPETAIGLGVPRAPIQLVAGEERIQLLQVNDPSRDYTQEMETLVCSRLPELTQIDGWIAKRNSPSCGLAGVPVYEKNGELIHRHGRGVFSGTMQMLHPALPAIEEQDLENPQRRGNFLLQVYTHCRWRLLGGTSLTREALKKFHHCHRYLLMARSLEGYHQLGCLLESGKESDISETYLRQMMMILKRGERRHDLLQVIRMILQEVADQLDSQATGSIARAIESCRWRQTTVSVLRNQLRDNLVSLGEIDLAIQLFMNAFPQSKQQGEKSPANQ